MYSGAHIQDYAVDTIAFALSLLPVIMVALLIAASFLEEPLRVRASVHNPIAKRFRR